MGLRLMAGLLCMAWVITALSPAQAATAKCVSIMVEWEPLINLVDETFEDLEADAFRGLEHVFVHKGDCLVQAPIPWRILPSADLMTQKMLELIKRPLRLGQVDGIKVFLEELNQAKLIRGFERKPGKNSSRLGCTEVVFELKVYGGLYALSISHLHRAWAPCPVKFNKNARGIAEIISTGVRAE